MKELGDKVPADMKKQAEDAVAEAKKALDGTDVDAIKAAGDKLQEVGHKLAEVVYSSTNADAAAGTSAGAAAGAQGASSNGGDDVVDADYEVVDDDKDNK